MRAGQSETLERGGVRAQLVGDQQSGCEALLLEQLAHQPQRRQTVASALNQYVEDLALVVDGTPQIHALARDPDDHFVGMPAIAEVQPHCVLDDDRRKTMRAIAEFW